MKISTFAVLSSLVFLGQGAPAPFTPGFNGMSWDAVTTDSTGSPAIVARYEVAISLRTSDIAAGGPILRAVAVTVPTLDKVAATTLTATLSAGEYRIWVRGVTVAGVAGGWSDPLLVALSWPLGKPVNLRVITFPADSTILIIPAGGTP